MAWTVGFHIEFQAEFLALDPSVQDEMFAAIRLLVRDGPTLGRPHADTLKGSRYPNMKELRFDAAGGVWRTAFAFDPRRNAILLVAGDKSGGSTKRFYEQLIAKPDRRYGAHLARLKEASHGKRA